MLKFGDYGGNINLIENGDLRNPKYEPSSTLPTGEKFIYIPSPTSNGLIIKIQGGGDDSPIGTLHLFGTMEPFTFPFPVSEKFPIDHYSVVIGGGQEVWIDNIEIFFE